MNENHIDYFLYSNLRSMEYEKYYRGTYAFDELNHEKISIKSLIKPVCFAFIFNTLKRMEANKMGHWISVHIRFMPKIKSLNLKFIDSYKLPYEKYGINISNYINRIRSLALNNNIKFNFETVPFVIQGLGSKVCGAYACYAIMRLKQCNQILLKDIFRKYDNKNPKGNDLRVGEYIVKNWPKKTCSDLLSNPNGIPFCPVKVYDHPKCLLECSCKKKCSKSTRSTEYIRDTIYNMFI